MSSLGGAELDLKKRRVLNALNQQVDGASEQINEQLRTVVMEYGDDYGDYKLVDLIADLKMGLKEGIYGEVVKEGEEKIVYRGVNSHRLNEIGVVDMAFLSTSTDIVEGGDFAGKGTSDCCLQSFRLSPGVHYYDLIKIKEMPEVIRMNEEGDYDIYSPIEEEILLEPGLVVVGVKQLDDFEKKRGGRTKMIKHYEITLAKMRSAPHVSEKRRGGRRTRIRRRKTPKQSRNIKKNRRTYRKK